MSQLFALGVTLVLNTLAVTLAGSLRSGLWTGYSLLSITVAWMVSGLGAALWVVILGASLGYFIRARLGMWTTPVSPLQEISGRISLGGAGALAGWEVWTLLGGTTPVNYLDGVEAVVRGILAVGSSWLVINGLGMWLTDIAWQRRLAQVQDNLALDALLQAVGLFMSSILDQVGILAFTLLMGLPAAQVIRHHQLQRTRRVLMQRFNEMAILNDRSHEIMFNPSREKALRAACEIAREISQARYAAIFLMSDDPQQHALSLSEIVGPKDRAVTLEPFPLLSQRSSSKTCIISPLSQSSLAQHAEALGVDWLLQINLTFGGPLSGVLALYHPHPLNLNSQKIKLLEMLAKQLIAALDNQSLLTTLEVFASEQAQLVQLARSTANTLEMEAMLVNTCHVIGQIIPARRVIIALSSSQAAYSVPREQAQTVKLIEHPCDFSTIPELASFLNNARSSSIQKLLMSSDVSAELRAWDSEAHWILIAPLIANRQLVGALITYHEADYSPSDSDARLLEMSLYQVAAQLYNVQLYTETQRASARRLRQLSLLEDIARQITQSLDVEQILASVLDAAMQATDSELAAVGLIEGSDLLVTIKEVLPDGERQTRKLRFEGMSGVMGQVAQSGEAVLAGDNRTLSAYIASGRQDLRSSLVVPLQIVAKTIGSLSVESTKVDYFHAEHLGFMRSLAGHAATTINNAKLMTAFQQSVERTGAILGAVKDGIVLLDEHGLLQSVNPAAEELLGLPLLAYLSLPLDDVLCRALDEQDERNKLCELVRGGRFGQAIEISLDIQGVTHHLQATLLPVANQDTPSGRLLVLRDISQEKRLARERQLVQKALVHDLLNPLQVIIYSFGILESDDRIPMDETNVYAFTRGMDAIQRLKRMANTILDVEKGIEARRVHVSLDEIIHEAIAQTSIIVEDQNNRIEYIADGSYILEADIDLLIRTLINLISNANKFLPKDREGLIRISTAHQADTSRVVIYVSDTGPGIPDDMREEIFKEYRQLETRDLHGKRGWGIGLTFCRMAVEAHQGNIWAEANGTVLSGACFAIGLPILQYLTLPQSKGVNHE